MTPTKTLKLDSRELAAYQAGAIAGRIDAFNQTSARIRETSRQVTQAVEQAVGTKKKNRAAGEAIKGWLRGVFDGMAAQLDEAVASQRVELQSRLDALEAPRPEPAPAPVRKHGILRRLQGGRDEKGDTGRGHVRRGLLRGG